MTSPNSRCRSRSASVTSPIARRSPDSPLRIAAKRAHPVHGVTPINRNVVARKWDLDRWRRSKRRRRDPSSSQDVSIDLLSDQERPGFSHSIPPMIFTFPTSSADFNFFPKSDYPPRRCANYSAPTTDDRFSGIELTRLRSHAFWELHKSIAENGEGFVQRMRDYERARSRQTPDHPRKGRKCNLSLGHPTLSHFDSDVLNDNDDIQIVAGEDLPISLDNRHQQHREFCCDDSGSMASILSTSFASPVDGDYPVSTSTDSLTPTSPSYTSPSSRSSPRSLSLDGRTSVSSIPPSPLGLSGQAGSVPSEKALSELSLALASGAGSINDYNHLQNLTGVDPEAVNEGGLGELWR